MKGPLNCTMGSVGTKAVFSGQRATVVVKICERHINS